MLEPSKPIPSVNRSSERSFTGIEKCCHTPGRSTNRKSTILLPASFAILRTSFGVFGMFPLVLDDRATLPAPASTVSSVSGQIENTLLSGRPPTCKKKTVHVGLIRGSIKARNVGARIGLSRRGGTYEFSETVDQQMRR